MRKPDAPGRRVCLGWLMLPFWRAVRSGYLNEIDMSLSPRSSPCLVRREIRPGGGRANMPTSLTTLSLPVVATEKYSRANGGPVLDVAALGAVEHMHDGGTV